MPPSTDQLSETERITKALKRFRPREAVKILAESSRGEEAAFLKTWALARLLAWAILDQRPGKRRPKKSKPTIRTANARLVGHLTLASLLDQRLKQYGARENDETLRLMLALFSAIGGFGVYVQGRGAKGLLSQAKKTNRKLGYVYRIVAYLCRYKQHIGDDRKFDIESAKYFVEKDEHCRHMAPKPNKQDMGAIQTSGTIHICILSVFLVAAPTSEIAKPSNRFSR